MLRIGPSGNSTTFYATGRKKTYEEAAWLREIGLTAFEYSFGRGVSMSDQTAAIIKEEFEKYDIEISAHAPYYTNFANESEDMIQNSFRYIKDSIIALRKMGGRRVVFHPATCGKLPREAAVSIAKENIGRLMEHLRGALGFDDYIVCPETMGKMQQIGRVEEIIDFCKLDPKLYPCYDFGHINCYMQGGLKGMDDYRRIIDLTFEELGEEKAKNIHIHFSKIEYGKGGEVRHLTFDDDLFGPDYEPLAKLIDEYRMTPFIICESAGVMSDDALKMKKFHQNI